MSIENDLNAIKRIFIEYPKMYKMKNIELEKVSSERQDLLHALELGKLNAIEMSKIMRDLKQVQIKRRQIKNNLDVLDEIKRFAYKRINERDIDKAINRVDHIVNRQRNYTMRERKDLQHLVDGDELGINP